MLLSISLWTDTELELTHAGSASPGTIEGLSAYSVGQWQHLLLSFLFFFFKEQRVGQEEAKGAGGRAGQGPQEETGRAEGR